jgi:predicted transposase/invertase (TIGR01784 family)
MQYEESLKQYRDLNNVLATSFEEGMIEGERKGMIKGKIEGKIEVARNLLKENMPIDIVARLTGLSEKEIEKLKAETE